MHLDDLNQHTEPDLFRLISEGDEAAFSLVYQRYVPKLHAFLAKTVKDPSQAKEILQDLFLNLWLHRHNLKDVEHPSAYIYRSASNAAAMSFRKLQSDRLVLDMLLVDSKSTPMGLDPFQDLDAKQLAQEIEAAVKEMPPKRQEVFRLARQEGLSRRQIAERMGISENTVKNHLGEAINTLQDKLRDRTGLLIPAILILATH